MTDDFWSGFVSTTLEIVEGNWSLLYLIIAGGIVFFLLGGFIRGLMSFFRGR